MRFFWVALVGLKISKNSNLAKIMNIAANGVYKDLGETEKAVPYAYFEFDGKISEQLKENDQLIIALKVEVENNKIKNAYVINKTRNFTPENIYEFYKSSVLNADKSESKEVIEFSGNTAEDGKGGGGYGFLNIPNWLLLALLAILLIKGKKNEQ